MPIRNFSELLLDYTATASLYLSPDLPDGSFPSDFLVILSCVLHAQPAHLDFVQCMGNLRLYAAPPGARRLCQSLLASN
jgi:hypothetical protein